MSTNPNSRHDIIQRGQALYEKTVRPIVEPARTGDFVVLDVESGDFEVNADKLVALNRLLDRRPLAVAYIVRAGRPTAVTLGAAGLRDAR